MLKLAIAADEPCKVVNAREMFKQLGVETLDLRKLDMSQCVSTREMFDECTSLKTLKQNWDLSNLVDGQEMFYNCRALTELDTSNWGLNKLRNAYYMFYYSSITSISGSGNWNLSQLENASTMFGGSGITQLDGTHWGLNSVTQVTSMFFQCEALTAITGSGNWDLSKVKTMAQMFLGCTALTELDASDWKLTNLTAAGSMFQRSGLTKLTINGQALKKLIAAGGIDIDRQQYGSEEISEFYNAIMTFTGSVQGSKFIITGLEKYRARGGDWEYPAVDSDEEM